MFFISRPGGHKYIDRGDIEANDYLIGDLTADGAWHDLDLSGIIPIGTALCMLLVSLNSSILSKMMKFRTKGDSGAYNAPLVMASVINQTFYTSLVVHPDSDRVVEYMLSDAGIISITIIVQGWFV